MRARGGGRRVARTVCWRVLGMASSVALLALSLSPPAGAASVATVFNDPTLNGSGGQDFVVPAGVCAVHVVALGAAGGNGRGDPSDGRAGGTAAATIPVTPGETLHVFVGGKGGDFVPPGMGHGFFGGVGGLNGGGDAGNADQTGISPENPGGGGGGASDVRQGGTEPWEPSRRCRWRWWRRGHGNIPRCEGRHRRRNHRGCRIGVPRRRGWYSAHPRRRYRRREYGGRGCRWPRCH